MVAGARNAANCPKSTRLAQPQNPSPIGSPVAKFDSVQDQKLTNSRPNATKFGKGLNLPAGIFSVSPQS